MSIVGQNIEWEASFTGLCDDQGKRLSLEATLSVVDAVDNYPLPGWHYVLVPHGDLTWDTVYTCDTDDMPDFWFNPGSPLFHMDLSQITEWRFEGERFVDQLVERILH